jgi:uncharacterized protein (DUF2062 family)
LQREITNRLRAPKVPIFTNSFKRNAASWLRQGVSPQRLALTLALGFAIGCIPVIGVPTLLCAALALALRLNQPAIQAANYAAMPLQLVLIAPFVRLGGKLLAPDPGQALATGAPLHLTVLGASTQLSSLAGHALLAWMLFAGPAVMLMTLTLTLMLRRIPALASAQSGD